MILLAIFIVFVLLMTISGYQSGLVQVLAKIAIWALVFYMATILSKPLAELFNNWVSGQFARPGVPQSVSRQGTQFLSSGLAFTVVMIVGSMLGHFLIRPIRFIRRLPILGAMDGILGGLSFFLLGTVLSFFILQVLSVLPNEWLQMQFNQSSFLNHYLDSFPIFSSEIYQWWL